MFGKNDSVDTLSRNLDHARLKRDALASDVTALTAQIAEIEARLSEEKNRRECDRVLGEIEAIKKRIKQTASALAPLIGKLCEATERAAAIVPEARALDSFLLSVATEVDSVIDPLLRELDRRADDVRLGHAALNDLPCLANEAPTELPSGDLPLERAAAGRRHRGACRANLGSPPYANRPGREYCEACGVPARQLACDGMRQTI